MREVFLIRVVEVEAWCSDAWARHFNTSINKAVLFNSQDSADKAATKISKSFKRNPWFHLFVHNSHQEVYDVEKDQPLTLEVVCFNLTPKGM